MPEPKLPTLSGEMRELRDSDRVRLRCGIEDTIHFRPRETWVGLEGHFAWCDAGNYLVNGESPFDIVLILGPSEETHGDGTVTRLCTLPVRLDAYVWQLGEPIAFRCGLADEKVMLLDGYPADLQQDTKTPRLILARKPGPTPTYTERLIAAVKAGDVVLPPKAKELRCTDGEWIWRAVEGFSQSNWIWSASILGPLPPWQPGDETTIDLAVVRAALTKENQ